MYLLSIYCFLSAPLKEGVPIPEDFSSDSGVEMVSMLVLWILVVGLKKSRGNLDFLMGSLLSRVCMEMLLLRLKMLEKSECDMGKFY